jgi:hypothetical protein
MNTDKSEKAYKAEQEKQVAKGCVQCILFPPHFKMIK